jgi:hypothetical protein
MSDTDSDSDPFLQPNAPMYNVGDLVELPLMRDMQTKGIVVSIHLKSREDRIKYWFADEYNYLVSIDAFGGDYHWCDVEGIVKKLDLPIEYKLSMVSKFGDWWYDLHKSVYQNMLIEALN